MCLWAGLLVWVSSETFDGLVFLGAYRADRAKHAVRLVIFR
jgi:hypothetical protein